MTTPRKGDTEAISRPKHGARESEQTQNIKRPVDAAAPVAPATSGAPAAAGQPSVPKPPAPGPVINGSPAVGRGSGATSGTPTAAPVSPSRPTAAPVPSGRAAASPSSAPPRPAAPVAGASGATVAGASGTSAAGAVSGAPAIPTRPPAQQRARRAPARGPRRARLQLRHIDPWSALKFSLVLSIAMFFVWMVAVGVLYGVLNGLDVFSQVNNLWGDLQGTGGEAIVTPSLVFGGAAVIGAVNILLFTALATIGAFIYNLCADLVGGLEITLGERD